MLWCFWTLEDLLQRWCCHCVHTLTPRGNRIYFKIFEITQYLMNTLYFTIHLVIVFFEVFVIDHPSLASIWLLLPGADTGFWPGWGANVSLLFFIQFRSQHKEGNWRMFNFKGIFNECGSLRLVWALRLVGAQGWGGAQSLCLTPVAAPGYLTIFCTICTIFPEHPSFFL